MGSLSSVVQNGVRGSPEVIGGLSPMRGKCQLISTPAPAQTAACGSFPHPIPRTGNKIMPALLDDPVATISERRGIFGGAGRPLDPKPRREGVFLGSSRPPKHGRCFDLPFSPWAVPSFYKYCRSGAAESNHILDGVANKTLRRQSLLFVPDENWSQRKPISEILEGIVSE